MDRHKQQTPVLDVRNLAVSYETRRGDVPAVRDVTLDIERGQAHSIVGESGCGKSTVAFSVVNFLGRNGKIVDGSILFQGRELIGRSEEELRRIRGDQIAMVYQDPMQALNPSLRIGDQLAEVLIVHRNMAKADAEAKCIQMLERVYMADPANVMQRFPHQLSGGQQQRVAIAVALANRPGLLLGDEPTGEVDSATAREILDLFRRMNRRHGLTTIIVTHDPQVARAVDRVVTIRDGSTSSETVRRVADVEAALASRLGHPGVEAAADHVHVYEEFVVVDGAGRLQIPPDLRAEVGIGSRVTLERSGGGILIRPVDGPQPAGNAAARAGDGGDDGPLPAPRPGLRGRLKWPRRVK